jgi:undecaprenyl pyrophosphate phosphatase UppP
MHRVVVVHTIPEKNSCVPIATQHQGNQMLSRRKFATVIALAALALAAAQGAWAQETKVNLLKVITVKDEIVIGLSDTD